MKDENYKNEAFMVMDIEIYFLKLDVKKNEKQLIS